MTVDTETILIKLIEELKIEAKQTNQRLTSIEVNQVRLEGKLDALSVDFQNNKEDLKELKDKVKGRISIHNY